MLTGHYKVPLGQHLQHNLYETILGAAFFTPGKSYEKAMGEFTEFQLNSKVDIKEGLKKTFLPIDLQCGVKFESVAVTYIATIKPGFKWNVIYLMAYERIPADKSHIDQDWVRIHLDHALRHLFGNSLKVHFLNEGIIIEGMVK